MNIFFDSEVVVFTNKIKIGGLKPGQPSFFFFSPHQAILFEEPTMFLAEEFVGNGSTISVHTWAAAADALKSWFQWLQAIKKEWHAATRQDRLDYRDAYLTSISPRTGQSYDSGTVAARMQVVRRYYAFAKARGWYDGDLGSAPMDTEFPINVSIDRDALVHLRRGRRIKWRDRDLPKSRQKLVIHALQISDLRTLINYCGPRAAFRDGDMRSARDRLFVDLAWMVGLRVDEIHSLTTLQFLNLHPNPKEQNHAHSLVITGKGRKTRQVAIPGWLVEDAIAYISEEREEALRRGNVSGRAASTALFLGGVNSTRPGKPISVRRLQQIVEEACLASGLTETVKWINPETREVFYKSMHKYSIHDLRHTAAVLIYHAELAEGNPEPWKKIQTQLGHKHLQTTIDTYLHHVEIFGQKQRYYDIRKMIGI